MSSPPCDQILDVLGELCPRPIILTQQAFKKIKVGEKLLVIADDPGVVADFPLWCKANRHTLISLEKEEGDLLRYQILLRRDN